MTLDRLHGRLIDANCVIGHPDKFARISPSGGRTPGLMLNEPRLLAVLLVSTYFVYLAGCGRFRTIDLFRSVAEFLGVTTETYTPGRLRWPRVSVEKSTFKLSWDHIYRFQERSRGRPSNTPLSFPRDRSCNQLSCH